MNLEEIVRLTRYLLSISILIQSFEMIQISNKLNDLLLLPLYQNLKIDNQNFWAQKIQHFFDLLYKKYFKFLIYTQILISLAFLCQGNSVFVFLLLLCHLLINFRFKGSFNGGSDYMTSIVMTGLFIYYLGQSKETLLTTQFGIYYIGIQSILSYFIAGIVKLKQKEWRNGTALKYICMYSNYTVPPWFIEIIQIKTFSCFLSWIVILLECLMPIVLFLIGNSVYLLISLFIFHIINYFLFGINRFVFAWLASYPALFYLSNRNFSF